MNLAEISKRMQRLKGWALEQNSIEKIFEFSSFKRAINFVNQVADIAENKEHHPDMIISYRIVRLSLSTHSEKTVTEKDFEVAEEIDKISL
ncbi:4a-hydroxytetrahydrobiopterin dehydratase [Candidatus Pacearchaeota archaeon CG_4_9_14_0_2_um_filter_39_13]|nr:4a-hydroxytetrahydrobiopterin dehydratase [Candidatus Pacearchaeota archaeon]PJC45118.1 MAG: 4a-hydroxytetrahydrobiopterin dehydratase [Candidatus Pacearchaeota archaeon CG_4_9_14_0_2_um_filter_39_13]